MAPPMKDLPRWLLENPEFSIAPDWTEIVKQSVSCQSKSYKKFDICINLFLIHITAPVQKEMGGYKLPPYGSLGLSHPGVAL